MWFQDLTCNWHFIANTFTDYFRLMVMHLGLPRWQYAFTDVGLDSISQVGNGGVLKLTTTITWCSNGFDF